MSTEQIITAVFAAIFFIAVFMALRGFFLWFWGISAINKNLDKQTKLLEEIAGLLSHPKSDETKPESAETVEETKQVQPWKCPTCETVNSINENICENCGEEVE